MVSEVAILARRRLRDSVGGVGPNESLWPPFALGQASLTKDAATTSSEGSSTSSDQCFDSLKMSERAILRQVLDEWEEPPEEQEFVS